MCILLYIYGSHSLELGEDIELFSVVQDFCLVTVNVSKGISGWKRYAIIGCSPYRSHLSQLQHVNLDVKVRKKIA